MDNEAAKKLFLEQASAFYDELKLVAANAPYGKVLGNAEAFAVVQGRELLRQSLEGIVQDAKPPFAQRCYILSRRLAAMASSSAARTRFAVFFSSLSICWA